MRQLGEYDEDDKITLLRGFDPSADAVDAPDLTDPFYGDDSDVTVMFDHCERACAGLLAHLYRLHGL